jgi:hypothetical protein
MVSMQKDHHENTTVKHTNTKECDHPSKRNRCECDNPLSCLHAGVLWKMYGFVRKGSSARRRVLGPNMCCLFLSALRNTSTGWQGMEGPGGAQGRHRVACRPHRHVPRDLAAPCCVVCTSIRKHCESNFGAPEGRMSGRIPEFRNTAFLKCIRGNNAWWRHQLPRGTRKFGVQNDFFPCSCLYMC